MELTRAQDGVNALRHPSRAELALYALVELQELVKGPRSRLTDGQVRAVRGRTLAGKVVRSIQLYSC